MSEKRSLGRRKKRLKVRFGIEYPRRVAFTCNASEKGLHILTSHPERPGTKLLIEIELPTGESSVAYGYVRWAKKVPANLMRVADKAGMGVLLTSFSVGEDAYHDYLKSLHH